MSKIINKIIYLFVAVAIFVGLSQLNSNNKVFAESRAICCTTGWCKLASCGATSSVKIGRTCQEYILTCMDCVEFAGNCDQPDQYCLDEKVGMYYMGNGIYKDVEL